MNNIEILEDYIDSLRNGKLFNHTNEQKAQAVENLIKENKELKKENLELHKEINQRIKLKLENERCADKDFIPKSKVKAMLEGITKEHSSILSKDIYSLNDKNIATFQYNAMRKILEEVLEEGGK